MERTVPYEFQEDGIWLMEEEFQGRVLLADDPGLGKTLQALVWAKRRMKKNPSLKKRCVVVVCPANGKFHWQGEAAKHAGLRTEILDGKKPNRVFTKAQSAGTVYAINYEILGAPNGPHHTWTKRLRRLNPWLVIFDEGHKIGNPAAKMTIASKALAKNAPSVIVITGTPINNRTAELWSLLNIVNPQEWPSFVRFARKYCVPEYTRWGIKWKGSKNLKHLNRRLRATCMVRRRKEDVLKNLPPKIRTVLPVALPPRAMAEYRLAEKEFIKWLLKTQPKRASKARKNERMVKFGYLRRLVGRLKVPIVRQWVENFRADTGRKVLVFGVHKAVLKPLYEERKAQAVLVDGSVTNRKRREAIDSFNGNPKVGEFYGNIRAAGVLWSCKSASDVLFAEFDWTATAHAQTEDRCRGIGRGQKGKATNITYLAARGTIDEAMCQVLQEKQGVSDRAIDGKKKTAGSIDVGDRLEQLMLKGAK